MSRSLFLLAAAGIALCCVGPLGCQTNEYVPPLPPTVAVARPVEQVITDVLEYSGTTRAVETVEIRARVKGFLEVTHFEEGAKVEADTLLYTIDPKPFQAELSEAQAALKLTQAQLMMAKAEVAKSKSQVANAEAQLQRGVQAAAGGAVTASEVDDLRTARDAAVANYHSAGASIASAEAQIAAAESAVEQAELNLGYTQIKTPLAGRAGRNLIDQGNLVGSGEPTLLTTVISYDPIYAYFSISELDLLRWMRTARAANGNDMETIRREEKKQVIRLALADEAGYPHEGRFDFADLTIDEGTGTFLVRGIFPNPNHVIPPGAFVRVQIPTEERTALLVPDTAVGRDQGGTYVLVVNSSKMVERRNLHLGVVIDGMQVVGKGLRSDEWVIVHGIQRARPGTTVEPQEAKKEPPLPETEPLPADPSAAKSSD